MNVVRCENGDFYDADKYQVCPHCGAPAACGETKFAEKPKRHISLFEKKKRETNSSDTQTSGKTVGLFGDDFEEESTVAQTVVSDPQEIVSFQPETEEDLPKKRAAESVQSVTPLQQAVERATSSAQGKTVGFFSAGASASAAVREPVVGWLVCIKGEHFGESFAIASGRNPVGRGEENKIVLSRDNTVSRSKHAWVTYEPKKREFFIQPGEGTGLSYLNEENVMASQKMKKGDELELGEGRYLFVPLCSEDFTWEDYLDKE